MGACGCTHLRDIPYEDAEVGCLSLDVFRANRIAINTQTPKAIDPNFRGEAPHPFFGFVQLGFMDPPSILLKNPRNDRLSPAVDRAGKDDINNDMVIDPYSPERQKKPMNTSRFIIDREIPTVWPPISQDEDMKIFAKGQLNCGLPAAKHSAKNRRSSRRTNCSRRTNSLPSLEILVTPWCERFSSGGLLHREQTSGHPELNVNVNYNSLAETHPPKIFLDDKNQWQTRIELISTARKSFNYTNKLESLNDTHSSTTSSTEWQAEKETSVVLEWSKDQFERSRSKSRECREILRNMPSLSETLGTLSLSKPIGPIQSTESSLDEWANTSSQTFENEFLDLHEREWGKIAKVIDQFEQKIYETKNTIRELRWESVNILATEMSEMASDPVSGSTGFSHLEIEQKICQLEATGQELENKRQDAVSRLQNKILGNVLGKELLPLLPITMLKGVSATIPLESQAVLSPFDVPITETYSQTQFSGVKL